MDRKDRIIIDWAVIDTFQAHLQGDGPFTADQLDAAATVAGFTFIETHHEFDLRLYQGELDGETRYLVADNEGFNNGAFWHDKVDESNLFDPLGGSDSQLPAARFGRLAAMDREGY